MKKLLACIDGSAYADTVCRYTAWAAKRLGTGVNLLHVQRRPSDYTADSADHTGAIGVGARSELLAALSDVDAERSRLDQQKGSLILEHGEKLLTEQGATSVERLHRRGSLVETIQGFEKETAILFIGKRGEHADVGSAYLGGNLEKVARAVHLPVFLASTTGSDITNFLIAYDGKANITEAITTITAESSQLKPLFEGLACHLLVVDTGQGYVDTAAAEAALTGAGFTVQVHRQQAPRAEDAVLECIGAHGISLVVAGAYSHGRVRSLLLGSTTANLIKSCKVPLMLFR